MKKVLLGLLSLLAFASMAPAQYATPTPWKPEVQLSPQTEQEKQLATLFAWRDSINRRMEKLEQGGQKNDLIAELRGQIAALNSQIQQMQMMQMQMLMIGRPIPLNPNPGPAIPLNPNPGPVIPLNPNPGPVIPLNPNPGPAVPLNPNPGPAIPLIPKTDPNPIPIPKSPGPGVPGPGPVSGEYQRFTSDRPPIITGTHSRPIITITIEKSK